MRSSKKQIFLVILLMSLARPGNSQGNMCGVNAPDPMKTCVSVRLPWQPEPIYFCIEKEKFLYRNQCFHSHSLSCGIEQLRNDTLIVATPWDCCPYTSMPDHCMMSDCPPPPMGRQCVTFMSSPGECCPRYFCEQGISPESCQMKRLDPTCMNAPQGKMNCVGFHDEFGCCPKYQCDGEGKPGLCPLQHEALRVQMGHNNSIMNFLNMPPKSRTFHYEMDRLERGGVWGVQRSCVDDANCPGALKCCSINDISVYGDGKYMFKNINPTYGHCQEPVMMAPVASPPS